MPARSETPVVEPAGAVEAVTSSADDGVGLIKLDDPETRNGLSPETMASIADALERFDSDPEVRCIVIAGSEMVFASGADLREMAERTFEATLTHPSARFWARLAACRTPMVAAVSGWALGGGCELALVCDMVVAAEGATFGQPEVGLGIIPGGGGTQRLTRAVGKHRAMELVLAGRRLSAAEAHEFGIVNRIAPQDAWLEAAIELAGEVATRAPIAVRLGKQAVLAAEETTMSAGLGAERRLYELTMATEDRVEGVQAFLEKRPPEFCGR